MPFYILPAFPAIIRRPVLSSLNKSGCGQVGLGKKLNWPVAHIMVR
jgi:hypothetical protein